ncbi:hypothetical protein L3X38_016871 [Prunus dulcis]|uniref:CCHC-type domain-containing protein n=1 Tax=Prunus dulcis TaxID=3755 RepID=A0AAD4Z991_PRUDU|nr:hypothetical protein L3X38_016871 [Prunus dulcis]
MSNMAGLGTTELRTPVFNGENYEFWSIRMKTILKSHGMWDLVEHGFDASDPKKEKEKEIEETKVAELLMKDARALGLIQSAVSDQLFPRIVNEKTSKGAWDILKLEFRGDKQDLETLEIQEVVASLKSFELRLDRHNENSTERAFTRKPKCKGCGKFGHMLRECHGNKNVQKLNYANQVEEIGILFYACNAVTDVKENHSWYIDIGCSNHMTETKLVKKHIQEVMLVPGLEENLLSVGQMMEHGCFPLTMMPASDLALKASVTHCLQTWHKRLGHLNERSIELLENQGMVHGLPHLEQISVVCEGRMLGKQHRRLH